jgi:transcriptional regulator with XRE-family HTH domain
MLRTMAKLPLEYAENNHWILYNLHRGVRMKLGNKLLELRKNSGFSQEELAEKLEVSRQTISKWELNESSPDIMQAQKISKIFKISLDELVDNDMKDILTEKIYNTERLAGLTIRILKIFGIFIIIAVIVFLLYKIFYTSTYAWFIEEKSLNCTLDGKTYSYKIEYITDLYENGKPKNKEINSNDINHIPMKRIHLEKMEGSSYLGGIIDIERYEYYYQFEEGVYGYFEKNGGSCSGSRDTVENN